MKTEKKENVVSSVCLKSTVGYLWKIKNSGKNTKFKYFESQIDDTNNWLPNSLRKYLLFWGSFMLLFVLATGRVSANSITRQMGISIGVDDAVWVYLTVYDCDK